MLLRPLVSLALLASTALAVPLEARQTATNGTKVGYLFTSFPVDDEAIYMHLSDGNKVVSGWKRLSRDGTASTEAILRSTVGTRGVRDSFIVPSQDGTKWWMTATDLNGNAFGNDFNAASRNGSRSMVIWESNDLANWTGPRLTPPLVDESAGNAWAPEANWDPLVGAYVVVFASRFFDQATDPGHLADPIPPNRLMYVTTTDFVSFSAARRYIDVDYPVIDATFIRNEAKGSNAWVRFVKDERDYRIYQEESTTGLLGTWTRVGDAPLSDRITFASQYSNNEGPLCFRDNIDPSLFHLWIDENTQNRYIPASARTLDDMKAWQADDLAAFPQRVKHGKVLALNQEQYDAIAAKYPVVKA
ncbi:uncharacterized protein PFL1_03199 [Pseudozyma flocculosa PF-1]|uniref:Glycosyl hydrolase family 32 N-terminal domain-containing protein n=2 Tax=Pseudozyma flocculosa TaxID=84751 RepID=A0A061HAE6_9BASI|nr:uncharacterized protein PFL1_03199 [Pseudozyma flocculosa PF-1]EPQ29444.1 hypothetical protein PFL1_03199 [Pseudozyma flocculosa PF-1]SPO37971.1 related to putative arabinase [Pseudozyma flocculosa]